MEYESPLFFAFLFIHLISLIVGFGAVVVIDVAGLQWMRGRISVRRLVSIATVTQPVIWLGWGGLVLSGPFLLYAKGFIDGLTWLKIFFVLMIGVNGISLHHIRNSLHEMADFADIPRLQKYRIAVVSVVSQVGWWGAIIIGFMHRHISSRWDWPTDPFPLMFGIAVVWLGALCIGRIKK